MKVGARPNGMSKVEGSKSKMETRRAGYVLKCQDRREGSAGQISLAETEVNEIAYEYSVSGTHDRLWEQSTYLRCGTADSLPQLDIHTELARSL